MLFSSLLVPKYSLRQHAALKGCSNYQFIVEYSPKIRHTHSTTTISKCVSTDNPTTESLIQFSLSETPKSRIAQSDSLRAGRYGVQTPVGAIDFFLTVLLPPPHPMRLTCSMGTGALSREVKRPGRGADHPHPG